MVKIRLKRMGTTKRPVYRLVVADSRSPRDGRFIEAIGFYDPLPDPAVVRIDEEKVRTWMRKGARPSDSARFLLVQQGILAPLPRPARPLTASEESTPSASADGGAGPAASGDGGARSTVSGESTPSASAAGDAGGAETHAAIPEEPRGGDPEAAGPAAGASNGGDATDAAAASPSEDSTA